MTIETKYNIGDEVFILMSKKVEKYPVTGIKIDVNGTSIYTKYRLYNGVGIQITLMKTTFSQAKKNC